MILNPYLILSLIIAITLHEGAHALAADVLGDDTPRRQGRISINPLRHLDLWGSLMILFVGIGWGKPVEYNPNNLKNPARDGALIGLAGPAANIATALVCAVLIKHIFVGNEFLRALASLSIVLAVFNLIPLPPLDGSHVISALFHRQRGFLQKFQFYAPRVLFGVIIFEFAFKIPVIWWFIGPVHNLIWTLIWFIS